MILFIFIIVAGAAIPGFAFLYWWRSKRIRQVKEVEDHEEDLDEVSRRETKNNTVQNFHTS
jgi:hypothetical protein